ncbi:MAG TPA: tetratricopeptide repeat-containing serine protease family protein [Candidatus Acidoferrum sp.]|nr:tetratricopeptide repeat-containing serine protease family protein [Candidatus Acidoferrum sp.]
MAREGSLTFRIQVRFFVSGLLLALLPGLSNLSARTRSTHVPEQKQKESAPSPQELYKRLSPSVFVVETLDVVGSVIAKGSAVAVAPSEVVTNRHVIEDGVSFRLKRGDHTWPATITHLDPDHDLCQLEVQGLTVAPVQVRPSATLAIGERVYAIGSPEGLELTLSEGLISGLREYENARLIQTSAAISPGSSGGGLFDAHGRLVGITSFYLKEGQNLNFVLPGEWVAALSKRESPGKIEPKSPFFETLLWFQLGYAFEETGDHEDAVWAYKEVIRMEPDDARAWYNLGVAYGNLRRYEEEIKAYQEAIRLQPTLPDAWNNLGIASGKLGRRDEEIKALKEAIRLKPDDAVASYNLGVAYGKLGRYEEEIKADQEAIHLKPDYAEAWNNLGVAYGKLGRYEEEIKACQEAIRLKPDYAEAWNNLGATYDDVGRHDDAIKASQEAIRLQPTLPDPWNNLGNAYTLLKRYDDAIKAYQEAIRLKPDNAEAWYNLGVAYASEGDRTKVMQIYEKLRQINPELADQFFRKVVLP